MDHLSSIHIRSHWSRWCQRTKTRYKPKYLVPLKWARLSKVSMNSLVLWSFHQSFWSTAIFICMTWLNSPTVESHEDIVFRTADLAALGLSEQVPRDIGPLETICIGWNICISWAGVAATLALTIALGGSVTLIYGTIVCFVLIGCSGLTMAELVSVYPTAGGQWV